MSMRDPDTRLSEHEFDQLKSRVLLKMADRRAAIIWRSDCAANEGYRMANRAVLNCRTEVAVL